MSMLDDIYAKVIEIENELRNLPQNLRVIHASQIVTDSLSAISANLGVIRTGEIMSFNYVAGISGFRLTASTGDAEFQNVIIRGELSSSVFKKNEVAAAAGTLGVFYSASTLYADYTTPAAIDASNSMDVKNSDDGSMLFQVNDAIRLKTWNGVSVTDSWFKVTGRTNHTTYTTYTVQLKFGSLNTAAKKGTAIADYGLSGTGFLTLSADGGFGSSANLSIYSHAGSPWTTTTLRARLGNLNGSYGATSDYYGVGIGDYNGGAGNYLSYNALGTGAFLLAAGNGKLQLTASGMDITDASDTTVSRLRWNYQSKVLGYVSGDYGGTGDGVMWVVASKDSGEPWTNVRVVLSAIDNTASPSPTKARVDFISDGTIDMQGNLTLTGILDTTNDIRTDGVIRLDVVGKSVQWWDSTTSDLMADILSQYADSTAKLWIRSWRQTGDPWTSGSSILIRAKDDVAGTEGALNIESTGDITTVAFTDYSATSTIVGWTTFGNKILRYKKIGKTVFVWFYIDGTSNATTTTFTVPYSSSVAVVNSIRAIDNGTGASGFLSLSGGSSTVSLYPNMAGGAWTNSGTKGIYGQFVYQSTT